MSLFSAAPQQATQTQHALQNGNVGAVAHVSHVVAVTDETFAKEVEQHDGLTVVDFWATWCGPCRMIAPILDDIAERQSGTVRIAKLDIDANQRTVIRYNVRSAPTMLFFKGGQVVGQIVGAVPRGKIEAAIAQLV